MTSNCILPREAVERVFNLKLTYDDEPDLPGLKDRLPAIYWDIIKLIGGEFSVNGLSHRDTRLKKREARRKVLHHKLMYKKNVFSEIVVVRESATSQLCYLQLVPVDAGFIPLSNLPNDLVFSFVYPILIKMTLRSLVSVVINEGGQKSFVTLINEQLATLFKSEGFVEAKYRSMKNEQYLESTVKQYFLEKRFSE